MAITGSTYDGDLEPHYLTRGVDREIYSIHPIGIAVLLAPVYGAAVLHGRGDGADPDGEPCGGSGVALDRGHAQRAGRRRSRGPRSGSPGRMSSTASRCIPKSRGARGDVCVRVDPAARRSTSGGRPLDCRRRCDCRAAVAEHEVRPDVGRLLLVVIYRLRKKEPASFLRDPKTWMVAALYAISLAGWFAFFYAIWGKPLPMAPCGSMVQTSPLTLRAGGPGLLFDQEYGLLALAPVYVLAATGLWQMWRAGGPLRRLALEITFIFGALLATVGAFGIWWGGASPPGRADRLRFAALHAADRSGVSERAERFAAARRAAFAVVDQHRDRNHARRRARRSVAQQRARWHVGAAGVLVAALGVVDAGPDLHRPAVDDRVVAFRLVAGGGRARGVRAHTRSRQRPGMVGVRRRCDIGGFADRDRDDDAVAACCEADAARRFERAIAPRRARWLRCARRPAAMLCDPLRRGATAGWCRN